jgi:zinc transport system substrate-binding protein
LKKFAILLLLIIPLLSAGCRKNEGGAVGERKLRVVTTLFPIYDFARNVGGDRVEVKLLLPPGVEPHNFEPKPEDMAQLSRADLFIYTNPAMEPWAAGMLKGLDKRLAVVDAGEGVKMLPAPGHDHDGHDHATDPHIWLNPANARKMVENIRDGLIRADAAGAETYRKNGAAYLAKLEALDRAFREGLATCRQRTFLHGGHYAFGYLADAYGLKYVSAYALSPNAEPTPHRIMELVELMRKNHLDTIFYEELISPRMAETVAGETGATLVKLHGIHNITREELGSGASYLSLMEGNLRNLRRGLQCS